MGLRQECVREKEDTDVRGTERQECEREDMGVEERERGYRCVCVCL